MKNKIFLSALITLLLLSTNLINISAENDNNNLINVTNSTNIDSLIMVNGILMNSLEIRSKLDSETQGKIDNVVIKYNNILKNLSEEEKDNINKKFIKIIESNISNLNQEEDTKKILILSLLKSELIAEEGNMASSNIDIDDLRSRLTYIQYEVTQNSATESPYDNKYWKNYEEGIYVDIVDGTPLFSSTDKYDSNTGWPSFTKPIDASSVSEFDDNELFYTRIEVKGTLSNSHLGHIFTDGPKDKGGLRYCINSASLKFIAKDDMKSEGYESYLSLFE